MELAIPAVVFAVVMTVLLYLLRDKPYFRLALLAAVLVSVPVGLMMMPGLLGLLLPVLFFSYFGKYLLSEAVRAVKDGEKQQEKLKRTNSLKLRMKIFRAREQRAQNDKK